MTSALYRYKYKNRIALLSHCILQIKLNNNRANQSTGLSFFILEHPFVNIHIVFFVRRVSGFSPEIMAAVTKG